MTPAWLRFQSAATKREWSGRPLSNAGELNAEDECDLDALRYSFLPVIHDHCDVLRITHNAGHKPGHGKPRLLFNHGAPMKDTDFTWDEFQRGCRLPFPRILWRLVIF